MGGAAGSFCIASSRFAAPPSASRIAPPPPSALAPMVSAPASGMPMDLPPGSLAGRAPASGIGSTAWRVSSGTGLGGAEPQAAASANKQTAVRMSSSGAFARDRSPPPSTNPLDAHDGELRLPSRPPHLHRVPLALAEQRVPERRLVADPVLPQSFVELVASDNLVRGLLAVFVLYGHGRPEEDAIGLRAAPRIDHLEAFQHLLQTVDPGVDLPQLLLAELVLVVLTAIAVRRRDRHLVGDARAFVVQEAPELLTQPLEPASRDVAPGSRRSGHSVLLPD